MITIAPTLETETLDVLFIADDPEIAEMYRLKLELDGYLVRVVSPRGALAAALTRSPDLVFLDLSGQSPVGLGILQELRNAVRRQEMPAIVLSSLTEGELQSHGELISACDYVVKIPATYWPDVTDRYSSFASAF
jgi:DNA-binding response OmpR family regulator